MSCIGETLRDIAHESALSKPEKVSLREIAKVYEELEAKVAASAEAGIARADLQIGWYCPGSKRFCYTDEKKTWPEQKRGHTVPVYAIPDILSEKQPSAEVARIVENLYDCPLRQVDLDIDDMSAGDYHVCAILQSGEDTCQTEPFTKNCPLLKGPIVIKQVG